MLVAVKTRLRSLFKMNFTHEELINMVYTIGAADGNCLLASRLYKAKYLEQRHPNEKAFIKLKERFEQSGSIAYAKHAVPKPANNEENQLTILQAIEENQNVSVRQISNQHDISKTTVNKVIKNFKYHPYHIQLHQELSQNDVQNRLNYCNWATQQPVNFFNNVLMTDEATFHSNYFVNRHNFHYYATENPRIVRQIDNQRRWSINVFGGVLGNNVLGPYFINGNLNANTYLNILEEVVTPWIEETIPLARYEQIWYQLDGAPAHSARIITNYLNNEFPGRWIGSRGPVRWPAKSPDLTIMDYFLWGYIKEKVYQTAPTTQENMRHRIAQAFQEVGENILNNVQNSHRNRLLLCIDHGGHIFEQNL